VLSWISGTCVFPITMTSIDLTGCLYDMLMESIPKGPGIHTGSYTQATYTQFEIGVGVRVGD